LAGWLAFGELHFMAAFVLLLWKREEDQRGSSHFIFLLCVILVCSFPLPSSFWIECFLLALFSFLTSPFSARFLLVGDVLVDGR
jgi:hypothetical protein